MRTVKRPWSGRWPAGALHCETTAEGRLCKAMRGGRICAAVRAVFRAGGLQPWPTNMPKIVLRSDTQCNGTAVPLLQKEECLAPAVQL